MRGRYLNESREAVSWIWYVYVVIMRSWVRVCFVIIICKTVNRGLVLRSGLLKMIKTGRAELEIPPVFIPQSSSFSNSGAYNTHNATSLEAI